MLSLGVIIVSCPESFAVDLTGFLFGDVLAVRPADLAYLGGALVIALVVSVLGYADVHPTGRANARHGPGPTSGTARAAPGLSLCGRRQTSFSVAYTTSPGGLPRGSIREAI